MNACIEPRSFVCHNWNRQHQTGYDVRNEGKAYTMTQRTNCIIATHELSHQSRRSSGIQLKELDLLRLRAQGEERRGIWAAETP